MVGRHPAGSALLHPMIRREGALQVSRRFLILLASLVMLLAVAAPTSAQETPDRFSDRTAPDSVTDLMLDTPIQTSVAENALDPSLWTATGPQQVIVRLSTPSLAESNTNNPNQHLRAIARQQDAFIKTAEKSGATVLAQVSKVLNAVFIEVDASALDTLAGDSAVTRIAPASNSPRNASRLRRRHLMRRSSSVKCAPV